jgi:hypothetical protein
MYKFIHYYIYSQQLQKGKSEGFARANGGMTVGFAMCVHFTLIISITNTILRKYFPVVITAKGLDAIKCIALAILVAAFFWFKSKKRTELIMDKLITEKDPTRGGNAFKVIAIIFVPMIVIFILAPKAN